MLSGFERLLAWRYLRAKKQESFVSVIAGFSFLGIMIGVATLIIVMAVMNGFREELLSRIIGLNGHYSVYSSEGGLTQIDPVLNRIEALPSVTSAMPMIERQALISLEGKATGVMVRGLRPADMLRKDALRDGVLLGRLDKMSGNKVAIGQALARELSVTTGDTLVLLSPEVKAGPFGAIPRSRQFRVEVVFDVGMYEYNRGYVFIPLSEAQLFFQMGNMVESIDVTIDNPHKLDQTRAALSSVLPDNSRILDWQMRNSSFYNALQVERNVMFLILTLIILVAAFNIISSMIMLVKDKRRDIAILRSMGASRSSMIKIFMTTGSLIGFAGTAVGAVLGISFALNIETIRQVLEGLTGTELFAAEIYFLSQLPAVIDWNEVVSVILMALALSVGATLYPAWRAAQLEPVEVLRYE